jgi:hypothetical protein
MGSAADFAGLGEGDLLKTDATAWKILRSMWAGRILRREMQGHGVLTHLTLNAE